MDNLKQLYFCVIMILWDEESHCNEMTAPLAIFRDRYAADVFASVMAFCSHQAGQSMATYKVQQKWLDIIDA